MPALPKLGGPDDFFWTSGADGRLRFLRCEDCGSFIHPPTPRCPRCLSARVAPRPVSGEGVVGSFTFVTDDDGDPVVVAWVELPEQPDLRLTAKLVGIGPTDVAIGMPVRVEFELHDDVHLPVFRPRSS